MGTFHHDKGELHGLTVLVEMAGAEVWIGRCDTVTEDRVILFEADRHTPGSVRMSRPDWIRRALQVGFYPRHDRVELPRSQVRSIRRLGELEAEGAAG